MKKSQIYTKTGDQGSTGLIGGTRVPKYHYRLEAYGTVDELNAQIGMIRAWPADVHTNSLLTRIQEQLFMIGAYLATDDAGSNLRKKMPQNDVEIEILETEMDEMESKLPPLKNFILPGGHPAVAQCHVVRTVCRRAERRVNQMATETEVAPWVMKYLNRLSDYFFVLSRRLSKYFEINEIPWKPEL